MKEYLLVFAVCVSFFVRAQETGFLPGYIVTKSNDTIRGEVKNKNFAPYRILQKIKFKRESGSEVEHYTADQLVSFQAGENLYVSKLLQPKNGSASMKFWEVLIRGPLSLYEYRETTPGARVPLVGLGVPGLEAGLGGGSIFYEIMQKEGEENTLSVLGARFKDRLLDYFANEPTFVETIKKASYYNSENIGRLVKEYNLLKFKAPRPSSSKKVMLTCYTRTPKNADSLILEVNDDQQYRFGKNKTLTVYIPENTPTKLCFGTRDKKECEIVYTLPFNSNPRFYELNHNGNFGKFGIDEKSAASAQRDISLMMRPKVAPN